MANSEIRKNEELQNELNEEKLSKVSGGAFAADIQVNPLSDNPLTSGLKLPMVESEKGPKIHP